MKDPITRPELTDDQYYALAMKYMTEGETRINYARTHRISWGKAWHRGEINRQRDKNENN